MAHRAWSWSENLGETLELIHVYCFFLAQNVRESPAMLAHGIIIVKIIICTYIYNNNNNICIYVYMYICICIIYIYIIIHIYIYNWGYHSKIERTSLKKQSPAVCPADLTFVMKGLEWRIRYVSGYTWLHLKTSFPNTTPMWASKMYTWNHIAKPGFLVYFNMFI